MVVGNLTILETVKKTMVEYFGLNTDQLTPETVLTDHNIDSLDLVEFAMELECIYPISVGSEYSSKWVTIQDIVKYLEDCQADRK